jgi:hypothetical protein
MVKISQKEPMIQQIRAQSRRDQLLILVFAVLIVYVISTLVIALSGIPDYTRRVTTGAVPSIQFGSRELISNALIAYKASERGLTLERYASYTILRSLVYLLFFSGAALLVLWKAGGNWFAWYTVFILLFVPTGGTLSEINQATQVMSGYYNLGALLWPLYLLYLYLFPNGRAVPRWTRWPMAAIIALHFLLQFAGFLLLYGISGPYIQYWEGGFFLVLIVGFPLILVSQVMRYRNHATPIERQQTKWFVGTLVFYIIISTTLTLVTGSLATNEGGWWGDLSSMLDLLIPISLVISILRFRLWDIDVIIRKTLVYGLVTAALALIYFGSVTLMQTLSASVLNLQSPVIIVISTLAIAALFNPLRARFQNVIDRRFYRRKYNAEQALAEFAAAARNETELDSLTGKMVQVTNQSLQPEFSQLWLFRKTD